MFDMDKDNEWSADEVKEIFRQYAAFMNRKLKEPYAGWEAEVEKGFHAIDQANGQTADGKISFNELE